MPWRLSRTCRSAVSTISATRSKTSSSKPWRPPVAVYKKTYRPYDGPLTASWKRFLVIPRYAFEDLHRSRFLTVFYIATFAYPLIAALIIYIEHDLDALKLLNLSAAA